MISVLLIQWEFMEVKITKLQAQRQGKINGSIASENAAHLHAGSR